MKFEHSITNFSSTLSELMARVIDDEKLSQDLRAAKTVFTSDGNLDHSNVNNFNEWYLLERDCELLGAPPAVAWAPADVKDNDLWHCLLDSFFGIFHVIEVDENSCTAVLECLWSARQIQVDSLPEGIVVGTLIPARVAQSTSVSHLLFPSANFIFAPELLDSLTHDLREIRGAHPRSRLSQLEWQRLWEAQQLSQQQSQNQTLDDAVAAALEGQSQLTVDAVLESLGKVGPEETLAQIALDTDIELDPLRKAFCLFDTSQTGNYKQAVDDFLQRDSNGVNLEQAFTDLEKQLQLDEGETSLLNEQCEATGVDDLPGVDMWLRSYLFDCQADGIEVNSVVGKEIEAFLNYCASTIEGSNIDPHQLLPSTVLAYMMGAVDLADLKAKTSALDDFVQWLEREQDAPLESILPLGSGDTFEWLQQLISCNLVLQQNQVDTKSVVSVNQVNPLSTTDDSGVPVSIDGFPDSYIDAVNIGDKLMGCWQDGKFTASAWMPSRLLSVKS
ncbi:MAG: hypothetical protein H8E25_16295 [Planctomycetes bacterium]|nr:hypothetical protein [Planctomycetota bacterium]